MKASLKEVKALVFDVVGTVVDWCDSCCGACSKGQSGTVQGARFGCLYLCSSES